MTILDMLQREMMNEVLRNLKTFGVIMDKGFLISSSLLQIES